MLVKNGNWKDFSKFNEFVKEGNIRLQNARLIPLLKTGDEQALTSIFLSSLKLIKEFRKKVFSDIKLKNSGKIYYFTEVCFKDIDDGSIFDGVILVVSKGKVVDSAIIEVKNDKNKIDAQQIQRYYDLAKSLGFSKVVTISNEFVSAPDVSVVKINYLSKNTKLFHLSWTYIQTLGQLLLFDNEDDIEDVDQIELMKEVLHYMSDSRSGVNGFNQMSNGWTQVSDDIRNMKKSNPENLHDAVMSWHQEEIDMKLMLSRHLGIIVTSRNEDPKIKLKNNINKLKTKNYLSTSLSVKGAVSNIDIKAEFERRMLQMSVEITPNLNYKTFEGRLNSLNRQIKKMDSELLNHLTITGKVFKSPNPIIETYKDYDNFYNEDFKKKDVRKFVLTVNQSLGGSFKSKKKFVVLIEDLLKDFYEDIVQNLVSYVPPPPTMKKEVKTVIEDVVEKDVE